MDDWAREEGEGVRDGAGGWTEQVSRQVNTRDTDRRREPRATPSHIKYSGFGV